MADAKKTPPPLPSTGDPLLDKLKQHREMMPPGGKYDTQLTDQELDKYTDWIVAQSRAIGSDLSKVEQFYDLRGYFKKEGAVDMKKNPRIPDAYSKPAEAQMYPTMKAPK